MLLKSGTSATRVTHNSMHTMLTVSNSIALLQDALIKGTAQDLTININAGLK
jgi:hypothetical protein